MKQQEEERKKEEVMIRLYAYSSEKKKVKTKKKIKKDISKYLAGVDSEKSKPTNLSDLDLESKDFVLPYMYRREFKTMIEENKLESPLLCRFYIIEESITILHLSTLVKEMEIDFSNVRLYVNGKRVKLEKNKLFNISCKVAKHQLSFRKKVIKALKASPSKQNLT